MKVAQNNRNFSAKECGAVSKYLFLKGKSAKKIYVDMSVYQEPFLLYSQELGC
jgi:hypothetical protein